MSGLATMTSAFHQKRQVMSLSLGISLSNKLKKKKKEGLRLLTDHLS